jgi:hypothetical protein
VSGTGLVCRHTVSMVRRVSPPTGDAAPMGELADGTLYYAPLGELIVTDDGDGVVCHLCGRTLRLLATEHLRRHGWTPQLYRQAFGLNRSQPLCAPTVSERRRELGAVRYRRNPRTRAGLQRGQALARSGQLLAISHASQPAGAAALQRRRRSAEVTATSREQRRRDAAARRQRLVRELGFDTERDYLLDRYVNLQWPVARIKAELGIGSSVLTEILDAAGIRRRAPGGAGPARARWKRHHSRGTPSSRQE